MHRTESLGVYQRRRVGIILEYNPGELLARAAHMHHDDKEYNDLKHYASLKEL